MAGILKRLTCVLDQYRTENFNIGIADYIEEDYIEEDTNTKSPNQDPEEDNKSVSSSTRKPKEPVVVGECIICAENYNASTRKHVKCMYCHFAACRKCCETYILNETFPHCMNNECGKPWSRIFIVSNFTKVFASKSLKSHLEDVAFDKEQALLPETQILIEYERNTTKKLEDMRETINILVQNLSNMQNEYDMLKYDLTNMLHTGILPMARTTFETLEREKSRTFIRACPADGCRGFLSSRWKCGICEKYTCNECYALKENDTEHVCNENDLATAKLLSKDTKPCPKCASMIFKIDGCDQMWCTECKTAFSWRTGKIETRIHNPHYYEYLRKNNQQNELENLAAQRDYEYRCGRYCFLDMDFVRNLERKCRYYKVSENIFSTRKMKDIMRTHIMTLCNALLHLERDEKATKFRTNEDDINRLRFNARMRYLKGSITKEGAKQYILKVLKEHEKRREYNDLLDMYLHSMDDIIRRLDRCLSSNALEYQDTLEEVKNFNENFLNDTLYNCSIIREINALTIYVNENIKEIADGYGTVKYKILDLSKPDEINQFEKLRRMIINIDK